MSTKNTVKTVRAIESAPPRTLLYFRLLMRPQGMTVEDQRKAVNAAVLSERIGERRGDSFTPHNTYSLGLLANTYGQDFLSFTDEKGTVRYMFRSVDNAEVFDARYPEFAAQQNRKASAKRKAEREAQAEREARKAAREARKAAKQAATPVAPVALVQASKPVQTPRKAPHKPVAPVVLIASHEAQGADTVKSSVQG